MDTKWNTNHAGYRDIFNSALSGICANPHFFSALFQQSPQAAVEFANECVLAAIHGDAYVPPHARTIREAEEA